MSSHSKIDESAFNRGVEEVLLLKPITRMVRKIAVVFSGGKVIAVPQKETAHERTQHKRAS